MNSTIVYLIISAALFIMLLCTLAGDMKKHEANRPPEPEPYDGPDWGESSQQEHPPKS